MKHRVHT